MRARRDEPSAQRFGHSNLVGQYVKGGICYTRSGTDNVCSKSSEATYPSYYGCAVRSDLETLWSWTVDH